MKKIKNIFQKAIFINSLLILIVSCKNEKYENRVAFNQLEKNYISNLKNTVNALQNLINHKTNQKLYFETAKKYFKRAEPIMAFIDENNYESLNQPNLVKVNEEDATNIKTLEPFGFQVLEELIYTNPTNHKTIITETRIIIDRINLLQKNTSFNYFKKHHIAWIIRDALTRVALKGTTGFDTPITNNSLKESIEVYNTIDNILALFKNNFKNESLYLKWCQHISKAKKTLNTNFYTFDRYAFIKNNTHKSLELWNETVTDWQVNFTIQQPINYKIKSLFAPNTFNILHFTDQDAPTNSLKVNLGKTLFNDKQLSNQAMMSCATCHQEKLAFTDGLTTFPKANRNTPTLAYAGLQKGFFYDNRTGGLEGQIVDVITNPNEFHSSINKVVKEVSKNEKYIQEFKKVYNETPNGYNIRAAIASYILSLNKFSSKFDLNISNKTNTLTASEIKGFSIFMGKGKCATCHFAPLFNGTPPINFKESEIELIGVPQNRQTKNPKIDPDLGRYQVFKTENRKYFFKTPTLRNIAKTAPYMHNGVFNTLEEVIEFYNKGGGKGMGINNINQTLPPDELNLTVEEKGHLLAFLKTLTDN